MRSTGFFLSLLFLLAGTPALTQDSTGRLPGRFAEQVSSRLSTLEGKMDRKSEQALQAFRKKEEKIRRKLMRLDSSKAKQVFAQSETRYAELQAKLENPAPAKYIPYLDTLKTSLRFLEAVNGPQASALREAIGKAGEMEHSLAAAAELKAFIKERKDYLKQQLQGLPFAKELKSLQKQAYYYSAQISEYRQMLSDPQKLERKAIELLSKTKLFQDFMSEHSQLASLFRQPGSGGALPTSLQGLQTRAAVNELIQSRVGSGPSAQAIFAENMGNAQAGLSSLQAQLARYGSGSFGHGEDFDMPDFKPNTQKTKSFFQRLELGGNVQSQKARASFPATSDLALSAGYKMNDRSVVGVGAAYRLGLGRSWTDMTLSHQGLGLRSFLDYRVKGGFHLTGGYEQNYRSAFRSIDELKDRSAWQSSGLLGLTKKYSLGGKLKGNVQLLWDFLSYGQYPRTQPLLFRLGYQWK